MTKHSGYVVTIKAFIPSPKNDFAKQAAAATAMQEITTANALPENFKDIATILGIAGKYGSVDIPDAAPVEETKTEPETVPDTAPNDRADIGDDVGIKRRGKTAE